MAELLRSYQQKYPHDAELPNRRAQANVEPRLANAGLRPGTLEEKCAWMRARQAARKERGRR